MLCNLYFHDDAPPHFRQIVAGKFSTEAHLRTSSFPTSAIKFLMQLKHNLGKIKIKIGIVEDISTRETKQHQKSKINLNKLLFIKKNIDLWC